MIETRVTSVVTKDFRLEVPAKALIEALQAVGLAVPTDAEVYVQVPGGGDWSNTSLDIDDACPVVLTWQTKEESHS